MESEKTIRAKGQWVKITRREDKSFVFARGYDKQHRPHDVEELTEEWIPTWEAAIVHAEVQIDSYV